MEASSACVCTLENPLFYISPNQVMYFSSVFPYVVLFIFLIRGLLLDGAVDGITYMFYPKVGTRLFVYVFVISGFNPSHGRHIIAFRRWKSGGTCRCGVRRPLKSSSPWDWATAPLSRIPPTTRSTTTATGTPSWSLASTS